MTRFAIAGAGWMSAVHGLAIRASGHEVTAVASRTTAAAEARVAETGGRAVAYEELPAGADIVVVATPPARHAVDALRAMANGAAVVIEKPLCTTLDDADRLVRVAEAGGMVTYAENLLFADTTKRALSEISTLGPLTHLTARAMQPRPTWGDFTTRGWGGGVFFDLGVHPLALVLRAAGRAKPVGVRAAFDASDDVEVEDRASVELRFDSGLTAQIEASWREESSTWALQAASDRGVVYYEMQPDLHLERSGQPLSIPEPPPGDHPPQLDHFGYLDQIRSSVATARNGKSSTTSNAAFGRDVLEIVCAASLAAASGAEVPLPYVGPRDRTPIELWQPRPR